MGGGGPCLDIYLFLTGIMVYAMLMILKKRTNLLSVPGRE